MECSECGQPIKPGHVGHVSREGYVPATESHRALGYVLCGDCAGRAPDATRGKDD